MIGTKVHNWFKDLSRIGKVGVVTGSGLAVLIASSALAGTPTITYKQQVVSESVPFTTTQQEDENMLTSDQPRMIKAGVNGTQDVTYKITYSDGKETNRENIKQVITKQPVAQVETVGVKQVTTETADESIPFSSKTVSDATLTKGTTKLTTAGVNGVKTVTYQVTKIRGAEISKTEISEKITIAPVMQVTSIGIKVTPKVPTSSCDPNYNGGCVPIASDVDCGGGSGNGPAYFYGTARVVGSDIYGLDRDGDGIACE